MGKLMKQSPATKRLPNDKKDPRPHINMGVLMAQQNKFQGRHQG